MSAIRLSRDAAMKVIRYSAETYEQLNSNTKKLNDEVMSHFQSLNDPAALQKFMELMMALESTLKQVGTTLDDVSTYCETIIRWIDNMESN